ncbi:hypothetical protein [Paenibacillus sp. y28]|uniref:hypothetical protein n=1 Tax=Paenibacillus sp. y28 TaxID=3129110 RepID=UPI003017A180
MWSTDRRHAAKHRELGAARAAEYGQQSAWPSQLARSGLLLFDAIWVKTANRPCEKLQKYAKHVDFVHLEKICYTSGKFVYFSNKRRLTIFISMYTLSLCKYY